MIAIGSVRSLALYNEVIIPSWHKSVWRTRLVILFLHFIRATVRSTVAFSGTVPQHCAHSTACTRLWKWHLVCVCVCEWHVFVCLAALLHAASRVYSTGNTCLDRWMSVVILFLIATPSTFFLRFLQNMTLMYCAQNCGTDFQNMLLKFSSFFTF